MTRRVLMWAALGLLAVALILLSEFYAIENKNHWVRDVTSDAERGEIEEVAGIVSSAVGAACGYGRRARIRRCRRRRCRSHRRGSALPWGLLAWTRRPIP